MKKYDLSSYQGNNLAERSLNYIYSIFEKDRDAKIIPHQQRDGQKIIVIEETNGNASAVMVPPIVRSRENKEDNT